MQLADTNRRILIIDDNRAIHADFQKVLGSESQADPALDEMSQFILGPATNPLDVPSFHLDSAFQGQEGFEMIKTALKQNLPYAMAFVDMRMPPGWDGMETIRAIWNVDQDIQIVVCTAFSDYSWEDMIKKIGSTDRVVVLKKPFDSIEVQQLANALTEKWHLVQTSKLKMETLEDMVASRTAELRLSNQQLRDEMEQKERIEEQFRQSQKMEAIGQLAGGVAHDFNNLLTIIQGYADLVLLREKHNTPSREALEQICAAAQRASHLTRQLLAFSRKQVKQFCPLDLNQVLLDMSKMLTRVLDETITLKLPAAKSLPLIEADPGMMEQIVLNLVVNAKDAMPKGGTITFETSVAELTAAQTASSAEARAGSFVTLKVADTGCGIPPEVLPRIFEPFFTTKEIGKGTGLGLATVYGIVKQHNGWIEAESAPGKGTTFTIFIPLRGKMAGAGHTAAKPTAVAGGKETILLVEDEPELLRLVSEILSSYGYRVLEASSGVEALKVWETHRDEVDLLLTDMVMPEGLSGLDLSREIQSQRANLKVVYTSGYSVGLADEQWVLRKDVHFLAKPYLPQALAQIVRETLDSEKHEAAELAVTA